MGDERGNGSGPNDRADAKETLDQVHGRGVLLRRMGDIADQCQGADLENADTKSREHQQSDEEAEMAAECEQ